jgi:hypothetical protein
MRPPSNCISLSCHGDAAAHCDREQCQRASDAVGQPKIAMTARPPRGRLVVGRIARPPPRHRFAAASYLWLGQTH